MEENFAVDTPDGLKIYGVKNATSGVKKKAIFISHGWGGHIAEYQFVRAAEFFEDEYDVYRINFYSAKSDGRKMIDTTLAVHADDLNRVTEYFGSGYEKIFHIGHSFGGPTIITAKPSRTTAVSFWDPSWELGSFKSENWDKVNLQGRDLWVMPLATHTLVNGQMLVDIKSINRDNCLKLADEFEPPIQVIHGTKDMFGRYPESYSNRSIGINIREYIDGAKHNFSTHEHCDILLEKTKAWFDRF